MRTLNGEIMSQVELKVLCFSCLVFAWLLSRKPSRIYLCLQLSEHQKHPFQLLSRASGYRAVLQIYDGKVGGHQVRVEVKMKRTIWMRLGVFWP